MTALSTKDTFSQYERLLWHVLSMLAKAGYVVPPQDARDLLHDFYVEAWGGVIERFDSTQSSFATYLSAAFYRFARRRIARLETLRHRLVDVEEASFVAAEGLTPHEHMERGEQELAVREALSRLPAMQRQVLTSYAADPPLAEREIARHIGVTRYAVRELLTDAVGKLATELKSADPSSTDSLVAFYLWQDDRSPREVASLLGLSVPDVQGARTRIATRLLSLIRTQTNHANEGVTMPLNLKQVKAGLTAPNFNDFLMFVSDHAAELRAALERDEEFELSSQEQQFLDEHPERLPAFYEHLSHGDDDADYDNSDLAHALIASREKVDREIGEAFEALTENVPARLQNWKGYFGGVEQPVDDRFRTYLMSDATVRYAGRNAQELMQFGVTPSMVFEATVAFQLLLDRVERTSRQTMPEEFAGRHGLVAEFSSGRTARVSPAHFIAQVQGVRDLPNLAAPHLTAWILEASILFPFLIPGYWVRSDSPVEAALVQIAPSMRDKEDMELLRRWTLRSREKSSERTSALKL